MSSRPLCRMRVDAPIYDFAFARYFTARRDPFREAPVTAVARVGAAEDYASFFDEAAKDGITLVHTPEQHQRCSTLPGWYPRIEDLTAKSEVFDHPPSALEVESRFGWPVFLKGERQTARHRRDLSIVRDRRAYEAAVAEWEREPILRWQRIAVRELLALRPVPAPESERISPSFEFRVFLWRGEVVGFGRYWWEGPAYHCNASEEREAIALARLAARRVDVPFLVVDVAQREDGRWVVIECNDGQESGYAGVAPIAMWRRIIEIESAR